MIVLDILLVRSADEAKPFLQFKEELARTRLLREDELSSLLAPSSAAVGAAEPLPGGAACGWALEDGAKIKLGPLLARMRYIDVPARLIFPVGYGIYVLVMLSQVYYLAEED